MRAPAPLGEWGDCSFSLLLAQGTVSMCYGAGTTSFEQLHRGWGGVGGIFFNQNIYFRQSAHMLKTWAVVLGVRIEECYKTLFALQATRM